MKNLVFAFALLCSTSLLAQFSFNGTSQTGIQSDSNTASGFDAFAVGYDTTASGYSSIAVGYRTTASGPVSTAVGGSTVASGDSSTAIGAFTVASGNVSIAMGRNTNAQDYASMSIGQYNKTDETPNPESFSFQNTAFVIGNGGYDSTGNFDGHRSNAFEVLFDGSTTIAGNVTAPAFIGDGSQLTNLPLVVESITEGGNTGVRLSSANANLYGDIGNNALDLTFSNTDVSSGATGDSSVALGENTTASGTFSTAIGVGSQATGQGSVALGSGNIASKSYSTAMGFESTASGDRSIAMGAGAIASGNTSLSAGVGTQANGLNSVAIGNGTTASGTLSTAMGFVTTASGETATATGQFTTASGKFSLSAGLYSNASGTSSVALGNNTIADGYGTLATGYFNTPNSNPQADTFTPTNTAFVIGNGTFENRSNAVEVLFDGTTTIAGDLNINSDARLKANIISLGATLSKLLQIDGKTYTMKKDANHKKKIGLLAQDIEKVFPELVTETNDIKSVNYQGLVPVLINAMKEQQDEINSYKNELTNQRKEIDELKTMVEQLISK